MVPGKTAPDVSVTVPVMAAVKPWAKTRQLPKVIKPANAMTEATNPGSANGLLSDLVIMIPPCRTRLLKPEPRPPPSTGLPLENYYDKLLTLMYDLSSECH